MSRPLRVGLAALVLVGLAWVAYLGSLDYPLLRDDRTLLDNAWLQGEAGIGSVFGHDYWFGTRHGDSDLYRPVTVLSLAWNWRISPSRVAFRLVNLLLHAAVTLLSWWMLCLVFRRWPGAGIEQPELAAWVAAGLFAVHPLAHEAVLFAVGRAELLAAAFGLAAWVCLLGGRGAVDARCAGSAGMFFLALGSKESAVAWLLLLAVWWAVTEVSIRSDRLALRSLIWWSGALVAFLALRVAAVGWIPYIKPWIDNPLVLHDPVTRVANAVLLQGLYLAKMVFPYRLTVEYGYDALPALPLLPWGLPAAAAVAGVWAGIGLLLLRRSRGAWFLWIFTPAAFAVTSNVVFPIGTIFAERLAYLPLVGFCGVVGYLIERRGGPPWFRALILIVLLLAGAGRTFQRTLDFRDHATFVEAEARSSPRAVKGLVNAGRSRLRLGRPDAAAELLHRAVEIWPDYARAWHLLGDAYTAMGQQDRAAVCHETARQAEVKLRRGGGAPR